MSLEIIEERQEEILTSVGDLFNINISNKKTSQLVSLILEYFYLTLAYMQMIEENTPDKVKDAIYYKSRIHLIDIFSQTFDYKMESEDE